MNVQVAHLWRRDKQLPTLEYQYTSYNTIWRKNNNKVNGFYEYRRQNK